MKIRLKRLDQGGFDHVMVVVGFVVLFALIGTWFLIHSLAASNNVQLRMWLGDSKTNTGLCLDDYGSSKSGGTPVYAYSCNSGDSAQQWQLVSAPGGFLIKNPNYNVCVDDKGGAVQTVNGAANRVPVITWGCNPNDKAQVWNWSADGQYGMLRNAAKGTGCINDPGGARGNTPLIVYYCAGGGKTTFQESTISSGGGGSGGGGGGGGGKTVSACSGTANQRFICRAQQYAGLGYANLGSGYGEGGIAHSKGYYTYRSDCEGGKYGGTPKITSGTNSLCATDCSGFISIVVDDVKGKGYMWIAGNEAMSGGSWDYVGSSSSLGGTKPGDIAVANDHVEFVLSRSGNSIRTYGEHQSGTTVSAANMPTPFKVYRWHYQ